MRWLRAAGRPAASAPGDAHRSARVAQGRRANGRIARRARLRQVLVVAELALSVVLLARRRAAAAQLPQHSARRSRLRLARRAHHASDAAARALSGRCRRRVLRSAVRAPCGAARRARRVGRVAVPAVGDLRHAVQARTRPGPERDAADGAHHHGDAELLRNAGRAVRAGALLSATDRLDTPPVAMVNQAFAARYLAGTDPIGQRLADRQPGSAAAVDDHRRCRRRLSEQRHDATRAPGDLRSGPPADGVEPALHADPHRRIAGEPAVRQRARRSRRSIPSSLSI